MDEKSPHFTGLRTLLGPLPKNGIKRGKGTADHMMPLGDWLSLLLMVNLQSDAIHRLMTGPSAEGPKGPSPEVQISNRLSKFSCRGHHFLIWGILYLSSHRQKHTNKYTHTCKCTFASVPTEKIRRGRLAVSAITTVLAILTYPFLSISSISIHFGPGRIVDLSRKER